MRQQHEITTSAPLLGKDGNLLEPGWARSLLPVYRRADIKASPMLRECPRRSGAVCRYVCPWLLRLPYQTALLPVSSQALTG